MPAPTAVSEAAPSFTIFSSDAFVDFLNADTNGLATLIFTRQSSNSSWNLGFGSKEYGSPTLTLSLLPAAAVVPEPSSAMLLVLGALPGLTVRCRRP